MSILFMALSSVLVCLVGCETRIQVASTPSKPAAAITAAPEEDTVWLGAPVTALPYAGIDPGFYGGSPPPQIGASMEVELGLRADGVCIWRKKGKAPDTADLPAVGTGEDSGVKFRAK